MSRNAARFTGAPSSAQGAAGNAKVKQKKFCTRGEEFFDFLKSLGYQPPKHQQAEHFEYLFHDEKSASFVKKLMTTLKPENCLSPEEIARFEDLEKQGLVLYGSDLEEAVARRRALNEMYSEQKQKKVAKKAELEATLEQQLKEVKDLEKLRDNVFMSELSDWQSKQAKVACTLGIIQCFIKENEMDIEIDLKLLNEKTEELENAVKKLKRGTEGEDGYYICQVDTPRLLEKEEKLFEKVQQMIKKHASNLIIKDAGYAVDGDPLNEENIRKIFFQYEKDFERLKHCIIFEKVNQIALELSIATQEGRSDKSLEECTGKAAALACLDFDTRAKLQMETRDNTNDPTIAFDRESEEVIKRVRELTCEAVNQQLSALTNIKARGKKKLQEFFTVTTNVLKAQRIRVVLIRNLVKSEGKLYGRLVSNIEANADACAAQSKKLASITPAISGLSEEGRLLKLILSLCGVSDRATIQTLASVPKTRFLANKCLSEIDNSYWTMIEERSKQCQEFQKKLCKTHEVLKNLNLSSHITGSGSPQAMIAEKEESLKRKKQELKAMQQQRAALAKHRQETREGLDLRMRDVLERIKNANNTSPSPKNQ